MPNPENLEGHSFRDKPENINKKGRPPSLKGSLRKLLDKDGVVRFKKSDIIKKTDKFIEIRIPERDALMFKLIKIAHGKTRNNVRAIQMILEHLEGKPTQLFEFMEYENVPTIFIDATEHLEIDDSEE